MNAQQALLVSKRQQHQPAHVLHLLLSVMTGGLWLPVWLLVAWSHQIERGKIDKQLQRAEQ